MYTIYNKTSESMSEVSNASVDLIYTSPPYNIGTVYRDYKDNISLISYFDMLKKVLSECSRILKKDGRLIIEVADTVVSRGKYIQLAGLIQSYCNNFGLVLENRHINFSRSDSGKEVPEHGWNMEYVAENDAHSNCHQILVFSKNTETRFKNNGEIFYINYASSPDHPCPIPEQMQDFIIDTYYQTGMTVADPFMGTASLGQKIVSLRGTFVGYEIDAGIYEKAERALKILLK